MGWIICEGLDRSGKSSIAEHYKKQGYKYIHMSAPPKKYSNPDYTGPSYFEETVEMYSDLAGQDVFFDRSIWGEMIWPSVFGRKAQLSVEDGDFDYLRDIEKQNDAQYIYMFDPNTEAHWKRCVDNKEPLNRSQFMNALQLYKTNLVDSNLFNPLTLPSFLEMIGEQELDVKVEEQRIVPNIEEVKKIEQPKKSVPIQQKTISSAVPSGVAEKLEIANVINRILSKPIIKGKTHIHESIEKDVRDFLEQKLSALFGAEQNKTVFSKDEVDILKATAQRIIAKS